MIGVCKSINNDTNQPVGGFVKPGEFFSLSHHRGCAPSWGSSLGEIDMELVNTKGNGQNLFFFRECLDIFL